MNAKIYRDTIKTGAGLVFAFALLIACFAPRVHAQSASHFGVSLNGGLITGLGADLGVGLNEYVGLRASVSGWGTISRNGNYGSDVAWDAKLKLFEAGVLLDGYPFGGSFRLTAGAVQDKNKFTLTGTPSAGSTYTFNGVSYPASDIASANSTVDWSKTVPYVGFGWGNLGGESGLHFMSDFGALISGSPKTSLSVVCAPSLSSTTCSQIQANADVEQGNIQNDVHNLRFWPVLKLGVGYTF
jgi:hypothetical protein